jgi:hypothetical protein
MISNWNLYYWSWMIEDGMPHYSIEEVFEMGALEFWGRAR